MKCLVYCIFRAGQPREGGLPRGIDGEPVRLVADEGLAAAFSLLGSHLHFALGGKVPNEDVTPREAAPSVERATAFAHVVDAFHHAGTVLPLRYGCVLNTQEQVVQLLRDRGAEFLAALCRLDGCVEMGLRVLLPPTDVRPAPSGACCPGSPGPGRDYLALRGAYYAARDGADRQAADIAALARAAFEGLFREVSLEPPGAGRPGIVSLCFLVRREDLAAFHAAFARFQAQCPQKALLTGPWPPYNFSNGAEAPAQGDCGAASIEAAQERAVLPALAGTGPALQVLAPQGLGDTSHFPRGLAHLLL